MWQRHVYGAVRGRCWLCSTSTSAQRSSVARGVAKTMTLPPPVVIILLRTFGASANEADGRVSSQPRKPLREPRSNRIQLWREWNDVTGSSKCLALTKAGVRGWRRRRVRDRLRACAVHRRQGPGQRHLQREGQRDSPQPHAQARAKRLERCQHKHAAPPRSTPTRRMAAAAPHTRRPAPRLSPAQPVETRECSRIRRQGGPCTTVIARRIAPRSQALRCGCTRTCP